MHRQVRYGWIRWWVVWSVRQRMRYQSGMCSYTKGFVSELGARSWAILLKKWRLRVSALSTRLLVWEFASLADSTQFHCLYYILVCIVGNWLIQKHIWIYVYSEYSAIIPQLILPTQSGMAHWVLIHQETDPQTGLAPWITGHYVASAWMLFLCPHNGTDFFCRSQ